MAAVSDGGADVSFVQIRKACMTVTNWNFKSGWSSSTKDCNSMISDYFLRGLDYAVWKFSFSVR